jgi:acetyl esterase/lipase
MKLNNVIPSQIWKSPIDSDKISSRSVKYFNAILFGDDVFWTESRPNEHGRCTIVRKKIFSRTRQYTEIIPEQYSARSTAFEYGGLSFTVYDGVVYFCNFADQRIYEACENIEPVPLTPAGNFRYADLVVDHHRGRLICVREESKERKSEPAHALVSISLKEKNDIKIITEGYDFYSFPCVSPDGSLISFTCWNHPNMPWDGTELWVASVCEDGGLSNLQRVAGGATESVFQPQWSPDNKLYFASDRNGWWNLYRFEGNKVYPIVEMEAEFGFPQWLFGMSIYDFKSPQTVICTYSQNGYWYLSSIDLANNIIDIFDTEFSNINNLRVSSYNKAVFIGSSPTRASSIVCLDIETGKYDIVASSSSFPLDSAYISVADTIEFPTRDNRTAFAFYYKPKNKNYSFAEGVTPPLIVMCHGGPTLSAFNSLNLETQYWTSRGFAVLDVNYRGSTGYGRKYREDLYDNWGKVDVEDCVDAVKFLVREGKADPAKLIIRGRSAGGYTALAALVFYDVFTAGASYYGVSDLNMLIQDLNKFESHYFDKLIGPYPEKKSLYVERSPLNSADKLSCPVIFFQGLEDKITPPNQSEVMVEALKKKGIPVAYITFEDEGHGFRKAENMKRALDAELYFYSKILDFELPETVKPIKIYNL